MIIRCPRCGRTGELPDQLGSTVQAVRCRICRTRFTPGSWSVLEQSHRGRAQREPQPVEQGRTGLGRIPNPPVAANNRVVDERSMTIADPDDSQYELPVSTNNGDDNSQFELPAIEPGRLLSDDEFPAYTDNRPGS